MGRFYPGGIFFDSMPYDPNPFFTWNLFRTFLINIVITFFVVILLFTLFKEYKTLFRQGRIFPYVLLAVSSGIPIDMFFLFLCDICYADGPGFEYFYFGLRSGAFGNIWENTSFLWALIFPTFIAFILLAVLHIMLTGFIYPHLSQGKHLALSGLIAFATLPIWGTLYYLY